MVLPEQHVYKLLTKKINRDIISHTVNLMPEGSLYDIIKKKHRIRSLNDYIPKLKESGLIKAEGLGYANTCYGNVFNKIIGMIREKVDEQDNLAGLACFGKIFLSDTNAIEVNVDPLSVHLEYMSKEGYFDWITANGSLKKIMNIVPSKKIFYENCRNLGYLAVSGDDKLSVERSDFAINLDMILTGFKKQRSDYNSEFSV